MARQYTKLNGCTTRKNKSLIRWYRRWKLMGIYLNFGDRRFRIR